MEPRSSRRCSVPCRGNRLFSPAAPTESVSRSRRAVAVFLVALIAFVLAPIDSYAFASQAVAVATDPQSSSASTVRLAEPGPRAFTAAALALDGTTQSDATTASRKRKVQTRHLKKTRSQAARHVSARIPRAAVLGRQARTRRQSRARTTKRPTPLDISKVNDPNTRDLVGAHSEGEAVVRAGILLDRLNFSPGEIGSSYNENLGKAIAAFQAASGLPAIGQLDAPSWAALDNDQARGHVAPVQNQPANQKPNNQPAGQQGQPQNQGAPSSPPPSNPQPGPTHGNQGDEAPPQGQPAIMTYTITKEDVAGPFTHLPKVSGPNAGERLMLAEARLPRLNYPSSLELLAEKFHSSPALLAQLNPGAKFDQEGEQIDVPNVSTATPPAAASVVVDATTRSVTALDANGKTLAFFPATVGSEHDPLPVGKTKVAEIDWNPKFKYNPKLFWDSEDKHPRATLPKGPRGPVGVVWIGLAITHYGIHGTPDPSKIGRTESHGCVRLTNWDAAALAHMVQRGTPVILEEGTPSEVKPQSASAQHRPLRLSASQVTAVSRHRVD
jgi:lipoprotein-anchoring transpeptidase ErfK/SrfK